MDLKRLVRNQWDRTLAIVLAVAGLLALYLGYRGVADSLVPAEQIPYLASGGLFGMFLLGVGATVWLSSDLRDEWRRIDDLVDALDAIEQDDREADRGPEVAASNGTAPERSRRRSPLKVSDDVSSR